LNAGDGDGNGDKNSGDGDTFCGDGQGTGTQPVGTWRGWGLTQWGRDRGRDNGDGWGWGQILVPVQLFSVGRMIISLPQAVECVAVFNCIGGFNTVSGAWQVGVRSKLTLTFPARALPLDR